MRVFKCKYVNITTDNIILSITVDIDGGAKTEQARRCRCCVWAAAGAEAEDDLPSQGRPAAGESLSPHLYYGHMVATQMQQFIAPSHATAILFPGRT